MPVSKRRVPGAAWGVAVGFVSGLGLGCEDGDQVEVDCTKQEVTVNAFPDIPIVFHESNGRVACVTRADENGQATGPALSGGMVSAISKKTASAPGDAGDVFTIGGLEVGDELQLFYPSLPDEGLERTVLVSFPAVPGAYGYVFSPGGGCSGYSTETSPATALVSDLCAGSDDRFTLQGTALGNAGPLAYAWIEDISLEPSGDTAVTLDAWQTGSATHTVSITGIPDDVGTAGLGAGTVVDGVSYGCVFDCDGYAEDVGATASFEITLPQQFGDAVELILWLEADTGQESGLDMLFRVQESLPQTTTIDVGRDFLPHVTFVSQSDDPARPSIAWSVDSSTAEADALVIVTDWRDPEGGAFHYTWHLVLPPGTQSPVRLPELPSELLPPAPPTPFPDAIMYFDTSEVSSYTQAKPAIFPMSALLLMPRPHQVGLEYRVAAEGDLDPIDFRPPDPDM